VKHHRRRIRNKKYKITNKKKNSEAVKRVYSIVVTRNTNVFNRSPTPPRKTKDTQKKKDVEEAEENIDPITGRSPGWNRPWPEPEEWTQRAQEEEEE